MPLNTSTGVYTPVAGAETALPGALVQSAVWNAINSDYAVVIGQLAGGAAVNPTMVGGFIHNVNFNTVMDNTVSIGVPTPNYRINHVLIYSASTTLTTSKFGVFTATGGTGNTVIAVNTVSITTANANTPGGVLMNTSLTPEAFYNTSFVYFRVTNTQGNTATGNVALVVTPLP